MIRSRQPMGLTPNLRRVLPAVGGLLTVAAACWWLDPAHLQPLGIVAGVLAMGVWLFLFQTAVLQRLVVGASQAGFFLLLNAAWLSAGPAMMAPSDTKMSMGPTPWLTMLVLVVAGLLLSAQAIVFGIPDKPTALFRQLVAGPPPLRPIRLTLRSARSAEEATAALTSRLAAPSLRTKLRLASDRAGKDETRVDGGRAAGRGDCCKKTCQLRVISP